MRYDDIRTMDVNLSENNGQLILKEIWGQSDWRCYSDALTSDTGSLIERFLVSHARMPGILMDEMLALVPVTVFRYTNKENGVRVEGATFINGAVITLVGRDYSRTKLLFVDDKTAERWSYPNSHQYLGRGNEPSPPAVST